MKDELGRDLIITCDGFEQVVWSEAYAPYDILFPATEDEGIQARENAIYNAVADAMVSDMRNDRTYGEE